jgi:hypothetical protein
MTKRYLLALALAALGATAAPGADEPKLPDAKTFDKLVSDALKDVHNKGAELYNGTKDFTGAFRVYQGALETVRPLLAHRPEAQQLIDTGLAAADKEPDPARRAFLLHEAIESVRKNLKTAAAAEAKPEAPPAKKPVEKMPDDKKPAEKKPDEKMPLEKKPDDKTPVEKKPDEKKPDDKKPDDKTPVEKKPTDPVNPVPVAPPPREGKPDRE